MHSTRKMSIAEKRGKKYIFLEMKTRETTKNSDSDTVSIATAPNLVKIQQYKFIPKTNCL